MANDEDAQATLASFVADTGSYITQYIVGADQKAVFLSGVAAAFLGFLVANGALRYLVNETAWGPAGWAAVLGTATSAGACLLSMWAVKPRLPGREKGLVSFLGIAAYESPNAYAEALAAVTPAVLVTERARHCYVLATICRRKSSLLLVAVLLEVLALLSGTLYFLLQPPGGGA